MECEFLSRRFQRGLSRQYLQQVIRQDRQDVGLGETGRFAKVVLAFEEGGVVACAPSGADKAAVAAGGGRLTDVRLEFGMRMGGHLREPKRSGAAPVRS